VEVTAVFVGNPSNEKFGFGSIQARFSVIFEPKNLGALWFSYETL
jgi:hypothetical protein